MTTTEKFVDSVTRLTGYSASASHPSDTKYNRCKIVLSPFLVCIDTLLVGKVYAEIKYKVSPHRCITLIAFSSTTLDELCQQLKEYLSTLQKALEPNERDCG